MELIDNEPGRNINSVQNTFSRGYETVLGSEKDESYYNLAAMIRNMPRSVTPEERDGAIGRCNQEGPYEVPEAVLLAATSTASNEGDPYQELRYYENTITS